MEVQRKKRRLNTLSHRELHFRLAASLYQEVNKQSEYLGISRAYFIQDAIESHLAYLERIAQIPAEGLGLNIEDEREP